MASWLATGSRGAGLHKDSYEEQQQKQQQHLTSRACFQVFINVFGARNIPTVSGGKGFYVTLKGMNNCGGFKLETPTVEKVEDVRWPGEYRMLHFEMSTTGLELELTCMRSMRSDKSLGRVSILFKHLLQQPELWVEAWYPLGQEKHSPELLVKTCIRPAVPSPYLLRAVKGGFQTDNFETKVSKKAEGRWSTRTVSDHNSEEKYLVRIRRAKVKKRYQKEWNAPVEEWEKEVCIFQQRFEDVKRKKVSFLADSVAGWAQQQIGTHSFKKNSHVQRQWSLFAGEDIVFNVQRDGNNFQWMDDLHLELNGMGLGYPVELRTGRHLQYEVSGAKNEDAGYESGYVTVIRKTPDCPTGKATALFNWKAIAMEVTPEENVTMVMLMAIVTALVVQGWYEEETTDTKASEKKKIKVKNSHADKKGIWGAVSMDNNNSMALSISLRKFQANPHPRIDAKRYRDGLNKTPQVEWRQEAFELLYEMFGGYDVGDVGGFEVGYIVSNQNKLGSGGASGCDSGGGGADGGGCGGGDSGGGGGDGGGGGGCGGGGGGGGG